MRISNLPTTFLPISTHACDGTRKVAVSEVIDLVERVRFEICYLRGGGEKAKSKAKAWWNSEPSGSKAGSKAGFKAREWKW